jgi:hypothetical protein
MKRVLEILTQNTVAINKAGDLYGKTIKPVVWLKEHNSMNRVKESIQGKLTKAYYIKHNPYKPELSVLLNDYNDTDLIPSERVFELEFGMPFDNLKITKLYESYQQLKIITDEYNLLQMLKTGLNTKQLQGTYSQNEKYMRQILENLFGLQAGAALAARASKNPAVTPGYKTGEYPWIDEIEISMSEQNEGLKNKLLTELASDIIKTKTDEFRQNILKGKNLKEYVDNYVRDFSAAMGKPDELILAMRAASIRIFEGAEKDEALEIAGGFLVYIPVQMPEDAKRQPADLSAIIETPSEDDLKKVYDIMMEYFIPRGSPVPETFELFRIRHAQSDNHACCILKEHAQFMGFFICELFEDELSIGWFGTIKEFRTPQSVHRVYMAMARKVKQIFLKTNIKKCSFVTKEELILQVCEKRYGFIREEVNENGAVQMTGYAEQIIKLGPD